MKVPDKPTALGSVLTAAFSEAAALAAARAEAASVSGPDREKEAVEGIKDADAAGLALGHWGRGGPPGVS
jgi:hypothetical protein